MLERMTDLRKRVVQSIVLLATDRSQTELRIKNNMKMLSSGENEPHFEFFSCLPFPLTSKGFKYKIN